MGPHTPHTPTHISTQAPTPTNPTSKRKGLGGLSALPPPTRHGARWVGQSGVKRVSHGPITRKGIGGIRGVRRHRPLLRSCTIRSGCSSSGSVPTFTFTRRTFREGLGATATPPPLHMRGGGVCGYTSHMGGGIPREGANRGALHPQPDHIEGYPLMLEGFRGEGALQCLPPTLRICQEHVLDEPLPGPIM